MPKCENIPGGSLIITVKKWKNSVFKTLRVNSLEKGAARHVQSSSDRVNINHRWNIFHRSDTFYLIPFNLKEGKMKLMIIDCITPESLWESGNDTGMPWIRNNCYFSESTACYHWKKRKTLLICLIFLTQKLHFMLGWKIQLINHSDCNNSVDL